MFTSRTFRQRLLRWFVVFSLVGMIMALLSGLFLKNWILLRDEVEIAEQAQMYLYRAVESQYKFFSYGTKDESFFRQSKLASPRELEHPFITEYRLHIDACRGRLDQLVWIRNEEIREELREQSTLVESVDSLFVQLVGLVHQRGFKDEQLEGRMRRDAHWLEEASEIDRVALLSLRRHEKDFIIRNQFEYPEQFATQAAQIRRSLDGARGIPASRVDTLMTRLDRYEASFMELVALDQRIGVKDNTGLKLELDRRIGETEDQFQSLVGLAGQWYQRQLLWSVLIFGGMAIALVVLSLFLSGWLSRKITRPLEDLTEHISLFVESNFEWEGEMPNIKSRDEIGMLTENFSHLKDEVIKWLRYFREKVEERTRELAEANLRLARISEANSRFVPDEFLRHMEKNGIEEVRLGDHVARTMSVLFADIRDFTQISESLTPRENFEFINTYLKGIVPIIQERGGFIDKFIGDTVMSLFPETPDQAVQSCFEMLDFLDEFNQDREQAGQSAVYIGCGIHTGNLILGTIGHEKRLETTVISDAVNTASRIESLTKYYATPVLITGETLAALQEPSRFTYRFVDRLRVKGKQQWVSVYECLHPAETIKRQYLGEYRQAVSHLKGGEITEALVELESLAYCYPRDLAVVHLKERCARFVNGDLNALEGIAGHPQDTEI